MFRLFTPILILQAFCLYHAYKNNTQQKWFLLIIIFPLVGCLIYLYYHFSGRLDIENITEGVKEVLDPNYKVEKLEKENRFSDTVANKIKLGNQYLQKKRYQDALDLYESCLNGIYDDDPELLRKLLQSNYLLCNYDRAIHFGKKLDKIDPAFRHSEERITFAWALYYQKEIELAESVFKNMDVQFTNYPHRIEYCNYLIKESRSEEAKDKLIHMNEEIEHMGRYEKKMKRQVQSKIKEMYQNINSPK